LISKSFPSFFQWISLVLNKFNEKWINAYPPGFLVKGNLSKFDKVSGVGFFIGFDVGIERMGWRGSLDGVFCIICER